LWLQYGGSNVDPDLLAELTDKAQSICKSERLLSRCFSNLVADFFHLVIMQWFNLLSTRTRRLSLFQQNPIGGPDTRNLYLFPAMLAALAIGWYVLNTVFLVLTAMLMIFFSFFSYVPAIQNVFGTRGIKAEYFFLPMAYVSFRCLVLLCSISS